MHARERIYVIQIPRTGGRGSRGRISNQNSNVVPRVLSNLSAGNGCFKYSSS